MNIQDNFNRILLTAGSLGTAAKGLQNYAANAAEQNIKLGEQNRLAAEHNKMIQEQNAINSLDAQTEQLTKAAAAHGTNVAEPTADALTDASGKEGKELSAMQIAELKYNTAFESYNQAVEQQRKAQETIARRSIILDGKGNNIIKQPEVKKDGKK